MTTISHLRREGFSRAVTADRADYFIKDLLCPCSRQLWLNGILIKIVALGAVAGINAVHYGRGSKLKPPKC